jgi:hypothetical protein
MCVLTIYYINRENVLRCDTKSLLRIYYRSAVQPSLMNTVISLGYKRDILLFSVSIQCYIFYLVQYIVKLFYNTSRYHVNICYTLLSRSYGMFGRVWNTSNRNILFSYAFHNCRATDYSLILHCLWSSYYHF